MIIIINICFALYITTMFCVGVWFIAKSLINVFKDTKKTKISGEKRIMATINGNPVTATDSPEQVKHFIGTVMYNTQRNN